MEKKLVKVPFDVELAKRIQDEDVEGKIITDDGRIVRIVCFDAVREDRLVVLVPEGCIEKTYNYTPDGRVFVNDKSPLDLMLKIPEYMTFKDGDIATLGWKSDDGEFCEWITILKSVEVDKINILTKDYVTVCLKCDEENYFSIDFDCTSDGAKWIRKPTETEKQKLIEALKESKEPQAREYLKRFFGIEQKQKYEFKPFDRVICRDDYSEWFVDMFSHIDGNGSFACIGSVWKYCLPYNEQTAHLLGTEEDYKEE